MFKIKLFPSLIMALVLLVASCKKDDRVVEDPVFVKGVYVVNEGGYLQGNASLSFYDAIKDTMYNEVFKGINSRPLGDVFQSMTFYDGKAYLVVNNSQKIEVVDSVSFSSLGTISGLTSPRHIHFFNGKAYVTDLYSNNISVYNPTTLAKIADIPVEGGTEKLIYFKDTIYATVQQSSYTEDSRKGLLRINAATDEVIDYMELREGAFDIALDANYNIWVMCSGDYNPPQVNGALYKIDRLNFRVLTEYPLPDLAYGSAIKLSGNAQQLYFSLPDPTGGYTEYDIYKMSIFSNTLPSTPLYNGIGKYIYGFAANELQGELYILDAIAGGQKGNMIRVNLETGADIKSYGVGYFPNNAIVR